MRFLIPLFAVAVSFAQTQAPAPSQDAQLTQALLTELRQLRQDLQVTAAAIQRVQLIMFRMQAATQTLNRASQRVDDARNRCGYVGPQRKALASQIEQAESRQRTATNPTEGSRFGDEVTRLKNTLELLTGQEQQCQTTMLDAETQLRTEQSKMSELQDQFDRLDRALAELGRK